MIRACLAAALLFAAALPAPARPILIGTGGGEAKGIYAADFDPDQATLAAPRLVAEVENPGFLALHPGIPVLYAACRQFVAAFRYDLKGGLAELNRVDVGGEGACHLAVHPSGRALCTANYGDGTVSAIALGPDGRLRGPATVIRHRGHSVHPRRQTGPHAHGTHYHGDLLVVPDLGLDQLLLYRHDPATGLAPVPGDPPFLASRPGDGPRHLAFHPDGRHAFVIHELSNVLETLRLGHDGPRSLDRDPTLPHAWEGTNTAAEVAVHPGGRWVFASNRGHDSIAVFRFDNGALTRTGVVPCGVKTPRHFTLDPSGGWLLAAGQDSNDLRVLRFDSETGALAATARRLEVPRPICVVFLPDCP